MNEIIKLYDELSHAIEVGDADEVDRLFEVFGAVLEKAGQVIHLVAPDGPAGLPAGDDALHHGRFGRQQRVSVPRLEAGTSAVR